MINEIVNDYIEYLKVDVTKEVMLQLIIHIYSISCVILVITVSIVAQIDMVVIKREVMCVRSCGRLKFCQYTS
jgi:hypothetical protein